ncbi:ESX secretion-associated protein EspG [Lentzea aerocolonigenes]|uniref:ESX secretion-associated protein EspG n=1 Tax=Lentzea aerocolonigenes TaxID=68170 RepID=UPI0004C36C6E|nr:ESX secretion-associated protein EspG [Lentzea aerocolonigenes]MCP2245527.1 EspG family protein [Lentzea aerocolonigenes]
MIAFDLVEMDLLATHAGVRWPFPLRVPSFGRLADERAALLSEAGHALQARGLAEAHGPVGVAAELVTALHEHTAVVDLVVPGTGAVAMVYGDDALVCTQSGSTVRVTHVEAETLGDELVALVPHAKPAQLMPITLPPGAGLDFEVVAQGQAGVVRGGQRAEVSWLDGAGGRVRVDVGEDGWVSVNPVRHNDLVRAIGELAAVARA